MTKKKANPQDSTLRNVRAGSKKYELLMRLYVKLNKRVEELEKVIYGSKISTKKIRLNNTTKHAISGQ
jgi:hypothetical protein